MARPQNEVYEFSDAEKRDLIALIQAGKPLPEKYRFLLFEDKREVELSWNGKSHEINNVILPFQILEYIDEPRKEKREEEELTLGIGGRQIKGWTNKLIWGDNKLILSSLKSGALRHQIEEAGGLKLIYIDPPFDVGADFSMDIEIGDETFHKDPNLLEQIAYRDTWGRGADSFISMIFERLILMRDLLSEDGCIYVHCDWRMDSYIRLVLEEIFGKDKFMNVITWQRDSAAKGAKKNAGQWSREGDSILVFKKSNKNKFRTVFKEELTDTQLREYMYEDPDGRKFKKVTLGDYSEDSIEKFRSMNLIYKTSSGREYKKYYLDEAAFAIGSIWTDVVNLSKGQHEQLNYPTQKPEALLERVLNASSDPGDLVADFFCGSGTTAAVAEKLGRKWIATDLGKFGVHTTRKRLIGIQRDQKTAGKPFRPFEVLNLGRYERQAYLNIGGNLSVKKKAEALARKEKEYRDLILRAYKAEPLEGEGFFQGKNATRLVVIGPINLPVGRLFVEEVITESRKRSASRVDILAFEFEMGLFPAVLEEAKAKGIDIAPKTIPPEVFDKRAVDKGQVRFHDVSYIEATPRFDKKRKLSLSIELTDFSVYYSQGLADSLAAELREGKSDVICDRGKLIKVIKDSKGVVKQEVLTKHWTDWVDYWAVDFNYESRKEIIKVAKQMGVSNALPGIVVAGDEFLDFEERWTGSYIFENEWQSFRTRKDRDLELKSASHTYSKPGRYIVAVKVIDIFGNDTMTLVPVNVS